MIKITKDGRTIRMGVDYSNFRYDLWEGQDGKCMKCPTQTDILADLSRNDSFHLMHRGSRGHGGSFRDDVLGPKKGQVEGGGCGKCHRQSHNQQEIVQSQPQWSSNRSQSVSGE